jgi:D-alanyl-D-alanine carboxypeptidase (penicillin-binding protein 5/6)
LARDPSVDGLKTGHTESAGYCLVTSAKRKDMRLISVVMGTASTKAREDASAALINYGFTFFESKPVLTAGQVLGKARVWKGAEAEVSLAVARDVAVAVPRGRAGQVQAQVQVPHSVVAPLAQSAKVGTVAITLEGKTLLTEPLIAQTEVGAGGFFGRMIDSVLMKFE